MCLQGCCTKLLQKQIPSACRIYRCIDRTIFLKCRKISEHCGFETHQCLTVSQGCRSGDGQGRLSGNFSTSAAKRKARVKPPGLVDRHFQLTRRGLGRPRTSSAIIMMRSAHARIKTAGGNYGFQHPRSSSQALWVTTSRFAFADIVKTSALVGRIRLPTAPSVPTDAWSYFPPRETLEFTAPSKVA